MKNTIDSLIATLKAFKKHTGSGDIPIEYRIDFLVPVNGAKNKNVISQCTTNFYRRKKRAVYGEDGTLLKEAEEA